MPTSVQLDRLAMRAKPEGSPVMHQNWENLLFLHWPVDPRLLRPLIPEPLEIDTFDGKAWIGITPFAMRDVHLISLPAIPGLDSFLELNVRTYVHYRGRPGVRFFSLDASKVVPTVAARLLFALPYFKADMSFSEGETEFRFESRRTTSPTAHFRTHWKTGVRLREPHQESLAFFLTERYCLFAGETGALSMTRVYHAPWILDEATVTSLDSTMISVLNLLEPATEPLAHFARFQNVEVWAPKAV